jgi:hypothetical protein
VTSARARVRVNQHGANASRPLESGTWVGSCERSDLDVGGCAEMQAGGGVDSNEGADGLGGCGGGGEHARKIRPIRERVKNYSHDLRVVRQQQRRRLTRRGAPGRQTTRRR